MKRQKISIKEISQEKEKERRSPVEKKKETSKEGKKKKGKGIYETFLTKEDEEEASKERQRPSNPLRASGGKTTYEVVDDLMAAKEMHKSMVAEEIAKEKGEYESDDEEEKPTERLPFPEDHRENIGELSTSVWAERFHSLLSFADDERKLYELAYLAHDFQHAAEQYGRIIISERYLPVKEKTIQPLDIGGIAGGDKYICRGILFKFAIDTEYKPGFYMYGYNTCNDASAMKAAGHELRSLARILTSGEAEEENVNVPLMTLVDFRGFRLTAVSVIPISKKTIIYGSHDGGKTVHADYPAFNERLEAIFRRLNLKQHLVSRTRIAACGDIEGHWGSDGALYLVDFARVFPPESFKYVESYFPVKEPRAPFFKLLRPEFVAANPVPLCSDAFSGWMARDPDVRIHNREVTEGTAKLLNEVIPEFVEEIRKLAKVDKERYADVYNGRCSYCMLESWNTSKFSLSKEAGKPAAKMTSVDVLNRQLTFLLHHMHTRGINRRYLGVMRGILVKTEHKICCTWKYRNLLYAEMAARVCKNLIRALLREKMKELKVPSSEPYRQLVLTLFNIFAGSSEHSLRFWIDTKPPRIDGEPDTDELKGTLEYYIEKICRQRESQQDRAFDPKKKMNSTSRRSAYSEILSNSNIGSLLVPIKCCIRAKFGEMALTEEEWESNDRTRPALFQGLFFRRLCDMLNIVLADAPELYDVLNGNAAMEVIPPVYEFMDPHLVDYSVRVKHLHLVDSSEGMALLLKGMKLENERKGKELDPLTMEKIARLLRFAREKLAAALASIPDHADTLLNLGRVEHWLALHCDEEDGGQRMRDHFESALKTYVQGIQILEKRAVKSKGERKTLMESALQRAQVLCDWSMAATKDLHSIKAENQVNLWIRAWVEFCAILKLHPKLRARFSDEIHDVVMNRIELLKKTKNSGMIVSTIMKIEALRKLEARQSGKALVQKHKEWKVFKEEKRKKKMAQLGSVALNSVMAGGAGRLVNHLSSNELPTRSKSRIEKKQQTPVPVSASQGSRSALKFSGKLASLGSFFSHSDEKSEQPERVNLNAYHQKRIFLVSHNGKFLSSGHDGNVVAGIQSNRAMWSIEATASNSVNIKDHHRKYLVATKGGDLRTNRDVCAAWEWIASGPGEVSLRAPNGRFISCSRTGHISVDKTQAKSFERWKIVEVTNKYFLRCCEDGSYLGVNDQTGLVRIKTGVPKEAFAWFLEEPEEGLACLRSVTGHYLSATPVGQSQHHHPHLEAISASLGINLLASSSSSDKGGDLREKHSRHTSHHHHPHLEALTAGLGLSSLASSGREKEGRNKNSQIHSSTPSRTPGSAISLSASSSSSSSSSSSPSSSAGPAAYLLGANEPKPFVWEKQAHPSAIIGPTVTLKLPDEDRWLHVKGRCCDHSATPTSTTTPTTTTSTSPGGESISVCISSVASTRWVLEPYNPYWAQLIGELYAELENLHGNRLVGQLRENVFAPKLCKLKKDMADL